ncbi:MAG: DoxX family protein [Kofleriaceae bacterium]|jgi:putative oxidoreductase|nr:DoxX family protein [Kofleriaceae bacterium]MBP6835719.1 DoxX family protein [Kofleriaceae bacterium]MBP9204952.1 DoxX family protein [Kofleriaceae bacterium]
MPEAVLARALSRLATPSYVALRIASGLMFAVHGAQKVLGVWAAHPQPDVGSQLWIGGVIELVAGLAIAVGLMTRTAAFLASGTMAVAYVQYHWKFAGGAALLPAVNHGELAAVYALLFLYIAARGPVAAALRR